MDKKPTIAKMFLTGSVPAFFISMFIGWYLLPLGGFDASMGPLMVLIFSFLLIAPLIGSVVLYKIKSSVVRILFLLFLTFSGLLGSYIFENNCDVRILEKTNCYSKKANLYGDISFCEKIKDHAPRNYCRNNILREKARTYKDISYCEKIQDEDQRLFCKISALEDF